MSGRPVLGVVAGLLFGVFAAFALPQWGIRPFDALALVALPLVGAGLGLLLAWLAPFGSR